MMKPQAPISLRTMLGLGVLCLGLTPQLVMGSAWTRPQSNLLVLMPVSYTFADEAFDDNGNEVDIDQFEMVEISPLFEYGVTDSFTLGMQPKYRTVWQETDTGTENNSGLAESDFFARQRLWARDQASFSIEASVKVPIDPDEDDEVPLGRDQEDVDLKLAYGNRHQAAGGRVFYSAEAGYSYRLDLPSDEAFFNAFIGWAGDSWSILLRSANTVSVNEGGNDDESEVLTAFPEFNRFDAQLIVGYRFSNSVALTGGVSTAYAGENVGIGNTAFLALSVPYSF